MAAVDKLTRQMLAGEQMSSVAALARDAPEWARAFVDAAERRVRRGHEARRGQRRVVAAVSIYRRLSTHQQVREVQV